MVDCYGFNSPYTLILDQIPIYAFILYSLYIITAFTTKNIIVKLLIPILLVLVQILVLGSGPAFILDIPVVHNSIISIFDCKRTDFVQSLQP